MFDPTGGRWMKLNGIEVCTVDCADGQIRGSAHQSCLFEDGPLRLIVLDRFQETIKGRKGLNNIWAIMVIRAGAVRMCAPAISPVGVRFGLMFIAISTTRLEQVLAIPDLHCPFTVR